MALLPHRDSCQAKAGGGWWDVPLGPLHPDTVGAAALSQLCARAAFPSPPEWTEVLQGERNAFQQGSGSLTKHCSVTALRQEVISKHSSGSCPLSALGFVFAFNARSILSELSPIKRRARIPLPQECHKGSVFT